MTVREPGEDDDPLPGGPEHEEADAKPQEDDAAAIAIATVMATTTKPQGAKSETDNIVETIKKAGEAEKEREKKKEQEMPGEKKKEGKPEEKQETKEKPKEEPAKSAVAA